MSTLHSIGTDVEVIAKKEDGHYVALCGKIGGTKDDPRPVKGMKEGFALQEDNVLLEFNIPPAYSRSNFIKSVAAMLTHSEKVIQELGFLMSRECAVSFDKQELIHPDAIKFGCEPDWDAYTQKRNPIPEASDSTLRTAGGHIHVGTNENMVDVACNMDLLIGVPSVLLDQSPNANRRRELYGKAGSIRPKNYGLEYRVLSNFWVFDNKLIGWIFDSTYASLQPREKVADSYKKQIISCINNSDKKLAEKLISRFGIVMP